MREVNALTLPCCHVSCCCSRVALGFHLTSQINVGKLDPVSGTFTGESDVYALAGYLRSRVSEESVN